MQNFRIIRSALLAVVSLTLVACAVKPVNLPTSARQPANLRPKGPIDVGLVLGSGGVRGVSEAGVIYALRNGGVPINAIIGTSAGSIVGALYSSNPDVNWLSDKLISTDRDQIVHFNPLDLNLGLVSGYTLQRYLLKNMPGKIYFRDLHIPLGIMTTDFVTGNPHFINSGVLAPAVNSSAAIPGVFRVVHLYGYKFIDGGVSSPIGTQQMREFYKPKLLICVSIHTDLQEKLPTTALSKMSRALDIVETNLEKEQYRFADVVIHPHVGDVGALDSGQNMRLYQAGVVAGKKALPVILKLMRQHGIAKSFPRHKRI
jgi:NTE family protein